MQAALVVAREFGASGWAAAEMLTALRDGLMAGAAKRRAEREETSRE